MFDNGVWEVGGRGGLGKISLGSKWGPSRNCLGATVLHCATHKLCVCLGVCRFTLPEKQPDAGQGFLFIFSLFRAIYLSCLTRHHIACQHPLQRSQQSENIKLIDKFLFIVNVELCCDLLFCTVNE